MHRTKLIFRHYVKWISIAALIGVASGIASGVFLISLQYITNFRISHSWLLYLLPVGGLLVGGIYQRFGRSVERGNNLIIDEFHLPQKIVPFRMAPLVLFGTLSTHLFGGSAGREGTAVQMGGSIADQLTHIFKIDRAGRRTLLMAGMSGGFGSVFGVPFAGTLFGLEVLSIGRLHLWGIIECAVAAFVAHYVTLLLGVRHTEYIHPEISGSLTPLLGCYAIIAGIAFGFAARLFTLLADAISKGSKKLIGHLPLRAFFGGTILSLLFFFWSYSSKYAGLGVPTIVDSLKSPLPAFDWLGKLVFTALTLGTGFKGGEVTPLLFVGATLGNALSALLPISLPVLAAMGFVAVFAGAANTPFACTVMAMELFGADMGIYAALACFASYAVSGHHGIYHSQQVHIPKNKFASRTPEFIKCLFLRPSLEEETKQSSKGENLDR